MLMKGVGSIITVLMGYIGQLKKTGQTTQYDGELDDGYYEAGLDHDYTVLTTGQYAGTTAIVVDGKTDNLPNECVLDNNTGLMWARYTSAYNAAVGPSSDGKMPWTGSADDIFQYAAAANSASLAGYNDWRVANDVELYSLIVAEVPSGAPDASAFPSWPSANYMWASGTYPVTTTSAKIITHQHAWISSAAKTNVYYCTLVRGGNV